MKRSSVLFLLAAACSSPTPSTDAASVDAVALDAGPLVVETFVDLGARSEGIALGQTPGGAPVLYVGTLDDRILRVAPDGVVGDFVSIRAPLGLAVTSDGSLVVCAKQPDAMGGAPAIFRVTGDGVVSTLVATGPGGVDFSLTNFVAVAPDDSIVFSDSAGDLLFRADADGGNVALITDTITYPNGLAFSPDGTTLYVASWDGTSLYAIPFDATTGAYGTPTVAIGDVSRVDGIVPTSTGSLVLVTSTSGILLVDPAAPTAAPTQLAPTSMISVPANGVFGDSAFGVNDIYVTSLARTTLYVVHTDLVGP